MSRWLLAAVLALAVSAIWAGAAFADASTYHQKYTNTTRACAGCHRAHTGLGDNLIMATTTYGLCTSCHGSNSGLDVVDGAEWQTDASHDRIPNVDPLEALKGGGFARALMNTELGAKQVWPHTATATNPANAADPLVVPNSAHRVQGLPILGGTVSNETQTPFSGPTTIWGIGALGSGAGTSFTLECSTCHDPHGRSGTDANGNPVATYRLLRSDMAEKVNGASGPVTVPEDSVTPHDYAVDDPNYIYYGQTYNNALTNVDVTKISQWCATCHTRVHTNSSTNSNDGIYNFRHRTDGNAVTNNFGTSVIDGGGVPACLTCHVAHGSNAAMTRQATEIPKPGTAEGGGTYLDGSLLRVDNRGVCELCHNK